MGRTSLLLISLAQLTSRLLPLLALLWSFSTFAGAKPFIEPYVGIGKLQLEFDVEGGLGAFKEISDGFFLGGKAGIYLIGRFFLAGDYQTGGPYQFEESLQNAEWTQKMYGAGLGADYKVIRFFAGYYPENSFEDSKSNVTYKGSAIKVGFGLAAGNKLRANLDLVFYEIEKAERDGTKYSIDGVGAESTHVSISMPIEF